MRHSFAQDPECTRYSFPSEVPPGARPAPVVPGKSQWRKARVLESHPHGVQRRCWVPFSQMLLVKPHLIHRESGTKSAWGHVCLSLGKEDVTGWK